MDPFLFVLGGCVEEEGIFFWQPVSLHEAGIDIGPVFFAFLGGVVLSIRFLEELVRDLSPLVWVCLGPG